MRVAWLTVVAMIALLCPCHTQLASTRVFRYRGVAHTTKSNATQTRNVTTTAPKRLGENIKRNRANPANSEVPNVSATNDRNASSNGPTALAVTKEEKIEEPEEIRSKYSLGLGSKANATDGLQDVKKRRNSIIRKRDKNDRTDREKQFARNRFTVSKKAFPTNNTSNSSKASVSANDNTSKNNPHEIVSKEKSDKNSSSEVKNSPASRRVLGTKRIKVKENKAEGLNATKTTQNDEEFQQSRNTTPKDKQGRILRNNQTHASATVNTKKSIESSKQPRRKHSASNKHSAFSISLPVKDKNNTVISTEGIGNTAKNASEIEFMSRNVSSVTKNVFESKSFKSVREKSSGINKENVPKVDDNSKLRGNKKNNATRAYIPHGKNLRQRSRVQSSQTKTNPSDRPSANSTGTKTISNTSDSNVQSTVLSKTKLPSKESTTKKKKIFSTTTKKPFGRPKTKKYTRGRTQSAVLNPDKANYKNGKTNGTVSNVFPFVKANVTEVSKPLKVHTAGRAVTLSRPKDPGTNDRKRRKSEKGAVSEEQPNTSSVGTILTLSLEGNQLSRPQNSSRGQLSFNNINSSAAALITPNRITAHSAGRRVSISGVNHQLSPSRNHTSVVAALAVPSNSTKNNHATSRKQPSLPLVTIVATNVTEHSSPKGSSSSVSGHLQHMTSIDMAGGESLLAQGSQQVSVVAAGGYLPSATAYNGGAPKEHHTKGRGYKTGKGYTSRKGGKKTRHGNFAEDQTRGYFKDSGGGHKGGHHSEGHKGHHQHGSQGHKGGHSGSKGHKDKGKDFQGFHQEYVLEENGRSKSFYDEIDHTDYFHRYDNAEKFFEKKDAGKHKGGEYKKEDHHDKYGNAGHHKEGHKHKGNSGHKSRHGHKDDYQHNKKYGKTSKDEDEHGKEHSHENLKKHGHGHHKHKGDYHRAHSNPHPRHKPSDHHDKERDVHQKDESHPDRRHQERNHYNNRPYADRVAVPHFPPNHLEEERLHKASHSYKNEEGNIPSENNKKYKTNNEPKYQKKRPRTKKKQRNLHPIRNINTRERHVSEKVTARQPSQTSKKTKSLNGAVRDHVIVNQKRKTVQDEDKIKRSSSEGTPSIGPLITKLGKKVSPEKIIERKGSFHRKHETNRIETRPEVNEQHEEKRPSISDESGSNIEIKKLPTVESKEYVKGSSTTEPKDLPNTNESNSEETDNKLLKPNDPVFHSKGVTAEGKKIETFRFGYKLPKRPETEINQKSPESKSESTENSKSDSTQKIDSVSTVKAIKKIKPDRSSKEIIEREHDKATDGKKNSENQVKTIEKLSLKEKTVDNKGEVDKKPYTANNEGEVDDKRTAKKQYAKSTEDLPPKKSSHHYKESTQHSNKEKHDSIISEEETNKDRGEKSTSEDSEDSVLIEEENFDADRDTNSKKSEQFDDDTENDTDTDPKSRPPVYTFRGLKPSTEKNLKAHRPSNKENYHAYRPSKEEVYVRNKPSKKNVFRIPKKSREKHPKTNQPQRLQGTNKPEVRQSSNAGLDLLPAHFEKLKPKVIDFDSFGDFSF